ncbi:MAG: hypothetical protein WA994_04585 [Ornithinimicrobium sp.]
MSAAPAAHADCVSPSIVARIDSTGTLVVNGEAFGTNCYDGPGPPEGQGVLGYPAHDISVVVRQQGIEWVVARGNADQDYTFRVDVEQPPVEGEAQVEARYAGQEGFTSQLVATAELTMAEPETSLGGRTVATFGQPTPVPKTPTVSPTESSSKTAPRADAHNEEATTNLETPLIALITGTLLGSLAMLIWTRRQHNA